MCAALYSITGEVVSPFCRLSITFPIQVRPEWIFFLFKWIQALLIFLQQDIANSRVILYQGLIISLPFKAEGIWTSSVLMEQDPILRSAQIKMTNVYSLWQGSPPWGGSHQDSHPFVFSPNTEPPLPPPSPGVSIIGEIPWRPPSLILASARARWGKKDVSASQENQSL